MDRRAASTTRLSLLLRLRQDAPAREVAWREFHECYAPIIRTFARRMGANADAAEDVIQDVMLGFFAAAPEFVYDPAVGRFRGYLKTCTWRKLQRRLDAERDLNGRRIGDLQDHDQPVEMTWQDVWEHEKLHRALAMVRQRYAGRPDKQRTYQAFEMCAVLERPTREVAQELGMSIDLVNQANTRIRRVLRETLDAMDAFAD